MGRDVRHGPAEERDQPVDGGRLVGDVPGRREPAGAGLPGQLRADEGEGLLGQVLRHVDGATDGLGEIPAVREDVVQPDLQPLGAGGLAERPR